MQDLEHYIWEKKRQKHILIMTHIVVGYPSYEESFQLVEAMVDAGVDLVELQIPFSEPIADGPVILKANQEALKNGVTVQGCLELAGEIANSFEIPFLIMSYYNIVYKHGIEEFVKTLKKKSLKGAIIADLPPEEGQQYFSLMKQWGLCPVVLFSPTTSEERMRYISNFGSGFVYCVARKGVTGAKTDFSEQLADYLSRCRRATKLPLALGFGVKEKKDIDFLKGRVEIAVIGTQTLRVLEKDGIEGVREFLKNLRE
jgi:tryptophan synthase alpha chain